MMHLCITENVIGARTGRPWRTPMVWHIWLTECSHRLFREGDNHERPQDISEASEQLKSMSV